MSLFDDAIAIQSAKKADRLKAISTNEPDIVIAEPSRFDANSGQYIAVTPDGGEVVYEIGSFTPQPSQISILKPSQGTAFGDWK